MDGVGEWTTTSAWVGENNKIKPLWEISFPHSLGLLYSSFTYYCGFKVNSGEYKLMGLAPYGNENSNETKTFIKLIKQNFNSDLKIEGILLTMLDKRNSLSSLVEKDVRQHFGDQVYKTTIPRNVKISEAPSHGKPALVYDTQAAGSVAYIELAKEVILNQNKNHE